MNKKIGRIAILGCGWLGLPLAAKLASAGYAVNGSTRSEEKLRSIQLLGIEPFKISVDEHIEGEELAAFFDVDLLIINFPPGRRHPDVETRHPKQVRSIVEAAQAQKVPRIIFTSSTGVYGNEAQYAIESTPLAPVRASGKALVRAEQYLQSIENVEVTILRLAGLFGGSRNPARFMAGKENLTNGAAPVNLVHLDDVLACIEQVIEQEAFGQVFNVCADAHPSRKAFYTKQAQLQGLKPATFIDEADSQNKIVVNDKIKQALGVDFEKSNQFLRI